MPWTLRRLAWGLGLATGLFSLLDHFSRAAGGRLAGGVTLAVQWLGGWRSQLNGWVSVEGLGLGDCLAALSAAGLLVLLLYEREPRGVRRAEAGEPRAVGPEASDS